MSYNQGYGQGGQGYGQYNPYGQQNPYSDNNTQGGYGSPQQEAYQSPRPGGYGSPQPGYGQNTYGQYQDERTQGGYEMGAVGNQSSSNPNRILDMIRQINSEAEIQETNLKSLQIAHQRLLESSNAASDALALKDSTEINHNTQDAIVALIERLKRIKADPESGHPRNAAQVGSCERRLRKSLNEYQKLEADFRRKNREMTARQYRIIRPEATEQEVNEAVEQAGPETQLFSQAMLNSDRRGRASEIRDQVQQRNRALQDIERSIVQLAQLFSELEGMVVQQDVQINQIETKANEANTDVENAAVQLDGAADKARAARKKKWICTGIIVAILIVIAIVVAVAVSLTRNTNPTNNNNNNP